MGGFISRSPRVASGEIGKKLEKIATLQRRTVETRSRDLPYLPRLCGSGELSHLTPNAHTPEPDTDLASPGHIP
ncbi:hypothetical protein PENANT_c050G04866 [Penicillium antarcticum]|uniref:Uncharacterized protein n=1 Tax=Penicillium antarcticum TaxID=416450 RepID=A0A1V6PR69_9EURO|nr:hypothetical protein PENANT_c050G04866 [Penicillium antarcticum]